MSPACISVACFLTRKQILDSFPFSATSQLLHSSQTPKLFLVVEGHHPSLLKVGLLARLNVLSITHLIRDIANWYTCTLWILQRVFWTWSVRWSSPHRAHLVEIAASPSHLPNLLKTSLIPSNNIWRQKVISTISYIVCLLHVLCSPC